jgi:poly-gamma-glutamate synthesis protein (capsule biosynthesis protein)
MYFIIGADIVPTDSNYELFAAGNAETLVGSELLKILNGAEYRIFNIEAPITDSVSPIQKCGPNLRIPSVCIQGLSSLKVDLVTLANNHILDQGEKGLFDTYRYLEKAGIRHVGTGDNLQYARKPFVFPFSGKRIGVFACAEHEFSIATESRAGANPFDPLECPDDVQKLKQECDYVIVLYHGGKEFYRYPSPLLQKTCRKLIEKGADLVICQHSHCIGCEEEYQGGTIVYGQGNFIFDRRTDEYWNTGLLIMIDGQFGVNYIPITKKESSVAAASEIESKQILDDFYQRSKEIRESGFIQQKYREFAEQKSNYYLSVCNPVSKSAFHRIVNRLSKGLFSKKRIDSRFEKKDLLTLYNCIDCEAHRELFISGLKGKIYE